MQGSMRKFHMQVMVTGLAAALVMMLGGVKLADARPLHDFDPATLSAYIDLRFSSAVPPALIREVLAGEGFSQRDLDLIEADRGVVAASAGATKGPGRQASRDRLACPKSDPTRCERDTETEPHIAVNPANPKNVVATFQMGRYSNGGAVDTGWTTSFDGGRTWPFKGAAPQLTVGVTATKDKGPGIPFERASDPVLSFDRKHKTLILQSVGVSVRGCAIYCDSGVTANVSYNHGKSFRAPVIIREDATQSGTAKFNDKNWIVTDNHRSSPYYGRSYAVWDQLRCFPDDCADVPASQVVEVSHSDDGGKTWSHMTNAVDQQPGAVHQAVGVQPLIIPNGDIVIIYVDANAGVYTFSGDYVAIRSKDGGKTWSAPVTIDTAQPQAEEGFGLRAPNTIAAAVNGNGKIYVAYQDQRFTAGRNDILISSSRNEGKSWSQPINATPGEESIDHFTPALAATGTNVFLSYRTHAPENVSTAPRVGAKYRVLPDGKPMGTPIRLWRASNSNLAAYSTIAGQGKFVFYGDYQGLAAAGKRVYAVWCQAQRFHRQHKNPTNTHQRTFVARL